MMPMDARRSVRRHDPLGGLTVSLPPADEWGCAYVPVGT